MTFLTPPINELYPSDKGPGTLDQGSIIPAGSKQVGIKSSGRPWFLQTHLNGCIKSSFKQTNHLMNSLTFNLFCFILLYKIMLLISRFESYLKMCGFEMGCDTKWKKSQIEKSQNRDQDQYGGILDRQKSVKMTEIGKVQ